MMLQFRRRSRTRNLPISAEFDMWTTTNHGTMNDQFPQGERESCGRTREKNSSSQICGRATSSTPSPIRSCIRQNSERGKRCREEFAAKTPTLSRLRSQAEYRRNQGQDHKTASCENCAIRGQDPRLVVVDGRCCHQGLYVHLLYVPLLQQQPCGQLPQQQPCGRHQPLRV